MNKTTRHDTCEHLLATGEQLCLQRGFTGMGLSELLSVAEVPKGSFYHYFRSKEAFGVAMLERYFAHYHHQVSSFLAADPQHPRQRVLDYYHTAYENFRHDGAFAACLSVKLSAEVCDLSEPMRIALERGSQAIIAALAATLQHAVEQGEVRLDTDAQISAETCYMLWLGASLQCKIRRDVTPLSWAYAAITRMLPAAN
ncbi:TetR/AcrR family transcriptional repressor of nem operon [Erwinia toletana]|uniref:TetR/AcrR family transcriptional repressor of nem operon n=1 Tax=Winslowiella toletana TaxID=92490 RepID=A0ABS4PF20_9GAMM|nr:TetR/AcrR family transcriptional regulator [Winslowiella toletana]MBP2171243.1 TetR/AcrR family transcriptional repressor of nem operon [Winslowiella toletana]